MCPVAYRSRRQITFSRTVKYPSGRGAHEGRLLPLLRQSGQAQRQDLIGVPAVEVHGLRRVDDGEVRRHGDEVSAGTLFTHLDPALAKAGPLPSTNNMIEGGMNSQLGAVPRNHRGPTSAKRVKAVFRWCHAHSGGTQGRRARSSPRCRPTRTSTSCSAPTPPRRRARTEGWSGATGPCVGPPPQGPVPVLAGLMDGNGCPIGTHILPYKPDSEAFSLHCYLKTARRQSPLRPGGFIVRGRSRRHL